MQELLCTFVANFNLDASIYYIMKRLCFLFWMILPLTVLAQYSVPLSEEDNGNKFLTVTIEGMPIDFTFDTGCSSLSINRTLFNEMLRRGIIRMEDVYDEGEAEIASGEYHTIRYFIIKRIQLGDYELHNIRASVGVNDQIDATPLLGQAVLERFSSYSISNNRLHFKPKPEDEQFALYKAGRLKGDTTMTAQRQIVDALKPFANRLSPRYQIIYADALCHSGEYEQSIAIYRRLQASGTYREGAYSLAERILHTQAYHAGQLYEDSLYPQCEQLVRTILEQAHNSKYTDEVTYAYTLLCYLQLQQNDYTRAEQSIQQFANYTLAPYTYNDLLTRSFPANEELAKLFYYLYQHFAYLEENEAAQRYKIMSDHLGSYKPE